MIFNVYLGTSIKDAKWINRSTVTGVKYGNIVVGHKIKKWGNFKNLKYTTKQIYPVPCLRMEIIEIL